MCKVPHQEMFPEHSHGMLRRRPHDGPPGAAQARSRQNKPVPATTSIRRTAWARKFSRFSLFWALPIPVLGKLVPCYAISSKMLFVPVNAAQFVPPTGIFETVGGGFPVFFRVHGIGNTLYTLPTIRREDAARPVFPRL